jgi:FkbM family methyltransferase
MLSVAASKRPDWAAHHLAIGRIAGELEMNVSAASTFSSALPINTVTIQSFEAAAYVSRETVSMRRLDDVVPECIPAGASFAIKMDVQGFERHVLEGAREALSRAEIVEVELCPVELYKEQWLLDDIMRDLRGQGYVLGAIDNIFFQEDGRSLAFNGLFVRQ